MPRWLIYRPGEKERLSVGTRGPRQHLTQAVQNEPSEALEQRELGNARPPAPSPRARSRVRANWLAALRGGEARD